MLAARTAPKKNHDEHTAAPAVAPKLPVSCYR
eukprot:CAMPEP_0117572718 /NCGR_PEP_ID=MMETSP0784-20121206/60511_1 /TAXON_ID=39447 /ORGANISM="" /LENGTH=31 /DNA_ID= /DNA_START= /DNA_END= /DNA_ORIENTATION=